MHLRPGQFDKPAEGPTIGQQGIASAKAKAKARAKAKESSKKSLISLTVYPYCGNLHPNRSKYLYSKRIGPKVRA